MSFKYEEDEVLPKDRDPLPHKRRWFRSVFSGDKGWMVVRDNADHIKLDRPQEEITKLYKPEDWIEESEHRPMTIAQVAQICFEADKKWCLFNGMHRQAEKQWNLLTHQEHLLWYETGPKNPVRSALYWSIRNAMKDQVG